MPRADITVPETAVALRLITSIDDDLDPGLLGILTRQMAVADDLIEVYAESAGVATKNEALTLIVGWLFESSPLDSGSPFVHSGARDILAHHHEQQTATVDKEYST